MLGLQRHQMALVAVETPLFRQAVPGTNGLRRHRAQRGGGRRRLEGVHEAEMATQGLAQGVYSRDQR